MGLLRPLPGAHSGRSSPTVAPSTGSPGARHSPKPALPAARRPPPTLSRAPKPGLQSRVSRLLQQSPMDLLPRRRRARRSVGSPAADPPANGPGAAGRGVRPGSHRRLHTWFHRRGLPTRRNEVASAVRATRVLPQLGRRKQNHVPAGSATNLARPGPPQPCRNRPTAQRPLQRRQQVREHDRPRPKHPFFPYLAMWSASASCAEDTLARRAGQQCVEAGALSASSAHRPGSLDGCRWAGVYSRYRTNIRTQQRTGMAGGGRWQRRLP